MSFVLDFVDRYAEGADRMEKTIVTMEIVQWIQVRGGRFIERIETGWRTVSDQIARDKIGQVLRAEIRKRAGRTSIPSTPY